MINVLQAAGAWLIRSVYFTVLCVLLYIVTFDGREIDTVVIYECAYSESDRTSDVELDFRCFRPLQGAVNEIKNEINILSVAFV